MTEAEWLASDDPVGMLEFLRGSPKGEDSATWWNSSWRVEEPATGIDRRFRHFACSCCRRIWDRIPEACNRDAVATVESYLDGHASAAAVEAALVASSAVEYREGETGRRTEPGYWAVKYLGRGFYKLTAGASALVVSAMVLFMSDPEYGEEARLAFDGCFYTAAGVFLSPFRWPAPVPPAVMAERNAHAHLLRCVFGNPFRPATFDGVRLTPAGLSLAAAAYDDRSLPSGELDPARLAVLSDALEEAGCDDAAILSHLRSPGPHARGCRALDLLLGKE
jgi:hypothetical protein